MLKLAPLFVGIALLFLLLFAPEAKTETAAGPGKSWPGKTWQRAKEPERLGWSSRKLSLARRYAQRIGSAAVMIVDDGVVVAAWGEIERKFKCHSMRKSFLSAIIGIHAAKRHIDLDATLAQLGIDDNVPSLSETEKQATVRDLLSSRSGIYHPALYESSGMAAVRPKRHSHAPGSFYYYNNWNFNALGTIFERQTGTKIFEEFKRRIAGPIEMEDFKIGDGEYFTGPDSIHPAYPFRMSARDLARFGLLFLRGGRWKNEQIVPADWVMESTVAHSTIGAYRGYGYMWGTSENGGPYPNIDVKARIFGHSGAGVHFLRIIPSRNLIVVHRVDTDVAGPYPSPFELGRLFWLILDAAGAKDIGACPFIEAAKGERLSAAGFSALFENGSLVLKGKTFPGLTEDSVKPYRLFLSENGDVVMRGGVHDTGRWWTDENRYCFQWKRIRSGRKACVDLLIDGDLLKVFLPDGTLVDRLGIVRRPVLSAE